MAPTIRARTAHQRHHVREHAVGTALLREDVIQMRALVVVEVRGIRLGCVQMARQLQHVVRVAALAGLLGNVARDRIGLLEILAIAVAADDVGCGRR